MTLRQDLDRAYGSGELDSLKAGLVPFLKTHKSELCEFIGRFVERNGPQPVENLIKYFILSCNMPFDMKSYMDGQSKAMAHDIGPSITSENRGLLIHEWIKRKAAVFREHSIMQQIYCFEMMKKEAVSQLSAEVDLAQYINSSQQ